MYSSNSMRMSRWRSGDMGRFLGGDGRCRDDGLKTLCKCAKPTAATASNECNTCNTALASAACHLSVRCQTVHTPRSKQTVPLCNHLFGRCQARQGLHLVGQAHRCGAGVVAHPALCRKAKTPDEAYGQQPKTQEMEQDLDGHLAHRRTSAALEAVAAHTASKMGSEPQRPARSRTDGVHTSCQP
eukprot:gene13966-18844_t